MLIPDDEILQSIVNLNKLGNKDWQNISDWFFRSYLTQSVMLIDMDDSQQMTIFIGRCRELKEFTHYLQNAAEVLNGKSGDNQDLQNPIFTSEEAAALLD